jgi:hypothetical protein
MKKQPDKFPIAVSESGLHLSIDDILTPLEALELSHKIMVRLFDWCALTGKSIDWEGLT